MALTWVSVNSERIWSKFHVFLCFLVGLQWKRGQLTLILAKLHNSS